MKKTIATACTLILVAVFSATVDAQPGPGGPGGPGGGRQMGPGGGMMGLGMMLRSDEIKSRLELTEDQVAQLQKISDEMRPQRGQGRQRGEQGGPRGDRQGGPRGERPSQADMERMRADMEKRQAEAREKINAVLTPDQQAKFKVLSFQMAGGLDSPFLNTDMLEIVVLTDEQKAKIKAVTEERGKAFREAMEKRMSVDIRGMSDEERRAYFEKERAEGEARNKKFGEQIQAVLTPEQLEKAKTLTEEGKDLRPQPPLRGEGGPGGPGGEYRPGSDSWQPGQGNPRGGQRQQRRAFPTTE